jgi:hypothetical protein
MYPKKYVTPIFVAWITDRRLEVGASISSIDELYVIFTISAYRHTQKTKMRPSGRGPASP